MAFVGGWVSVFGKYTATNMQHGAEIAAVNKMYGGWGVDVYTSKLGTLQHATFPYNQGSMYGPLG